MFLSNLVLQPFVPKKHTDIFINHKLVDILAQASYKLILTS